MTPIANQETQVAMKVGNDGGWCGITVNNSGKPYAAGLLIAKPVHGQVFIHTVGDDTRIDFTPDRGAGGTDAFAVRLIPKNATIRVSVAIGSPWTARVSGASSAATLRGAGRAWATSGQTSVEAGTRFLPEA